MDDNNTIKSNVEDLELMLGDDESTALSLRVQGFDDDKSYHRFIKNVEKLVRTSLEYREWIKYIIDVLGYTNCEMTDERSSEVTVEIHHHPITLYTIVKGVIVNYINKEKEFCTYDIASETIQLHFQNRVGFIPIVKTLHEKYHNGYLDIPIDFCHGEWKYIINNFPLEDEEMQNILRLASVKKESLKEQWSRSSYSKVINE